MSGPALLSVLATAWLSGSDSHLLTSPPSYSPGQQNLRPLQLEVEGGGLVVTLAAVVTFFVALLFAVLVTYRFLEGYRRTGSRPIFWLTIGLFLLAPAPMFIRLIAGNTALISLELQALLTTISELCGLLTILYVIYTPRTRT